MKEVFHADRYPSTRIASGSEGFPHRIESPPIGTAYLFGDMVCFHGRPGRKPPVAWYRIGPMI